MHVRHILTSHLHIGRLKEDNNQVPKLLFSVNPGMLLPPHRVNDVAEWMGNPQLLGSETLVIFHKKSIFIASVRKLESLSTTFW